MSLHRLAAAGLLALHASAAIASPAAPAPLAYAAPVATMMTADAPGVWRAPYAIVLLLALLALVAIGFAAASAIRLTRVRRHADALDAATAQQATALQLERDGREAAAAELLATTAALAASQSHLLAVFDHLRAGVLIVDADRRVRFVNRAAQTRLATLHGGPIGRTIDEVLPVTRESLGPLQRALASRETDARLHVSLCHGSGARAPVEIDLRVDPRDERQRILYLHDAAAQAADAASAGGQAAAIVSDPLPPETDSLIAGLIGKSTAMRAVHTQILTLAAVDATVLIEGETGTGKELVARAIHGASRRKDRPFVAINCAGLTESLLASQLFGHRRGAFTGAVSDHVGLFESAQGGTLLLDEIGDMPMSIQTHLLRVLQEREILRLGDTRPRPFDVRLLVATHRSLDREVADGKFREDLLYRIRVARIALPALRQRLGDVPLLAMAFLRQLAALHDKPLHGFTRDAMDLLVAHRWPGNVRELRGAIEWAIIRATGPMIGPTDLPPDLLPIDVPPTRGALLESDRRRLVETLMRTGGNRAVAARLLGISRATLYRRLAILEAEQVEKAASGGEN